MKFLENFSIEPNDSHLYELAFLHESYSNEIISNQVNVIGTDVPLPFHSSITINPDIGTVSEIFPTYGILLLFSSDNKITDNDVFMTSGFTTP